MARRRVAEGAAIVLDSSLLVALFNERDVHHASAIRAMAQVGAGRWGRAILLEYVVLEVVTVLLSRRGFEFAARVGASLVASDELTFFPCSGLFHETWAEFSAQRGTKLSFADAAIVVAARSLAGGNVATFDKDFHGIKGITVLPS
jgi:predicted nucleic acid-binding protein